MSDGRSPARNPEDSPEVGAPSHPRWRLGLLAALLALAFGIQAFWLEPRQLLLRDEVGVELPARLPIPPLRLIHFSDLHIRRETPLLRRLMVRVWEERPDAIVISGDLISDSHDPGTSQRRTDAVAAVITELRRAAPVWAVQGHSEYQGEVVAALGRAGVRWLSNEGVLLSPAGPLLLGLNQQVGLDALPGADGALHLEQERAFHLREVAGEPAMAVFREGRREGPRDNLYLHYDPLVSGAATGERLARTDGPLAWSGYELTCEVWIGRRSAGAGVAVHSRFVAGEDRMLRLRRVGAGGAGEAGTFRLVPHGTAFTAGEPDTGVVPEPRRWYRLRVRTEVTEGTVRVRAKVWPADRAEPPEWQARVEDDSPTRVTAGTVGLWGWEEGAAAYRNLRVTDADGAVLLEEAFAGSGIGGSRVPVGWREGARGSRLALALARSSQIERGEQGQRPVPRIVLSHVPGVVLEAAHRGIDVVLAGHTHGGQVRLPWLGALTTRSRLGDHYDRGVFHFGSPSPRGWTTLHVSSGIGTSVVPLRTFNPPRYAVLSLRSGR